MGSQLEQQFVVRVIQKLDRACAEEAHLIEHLVVLLELFDGKNAHEDLKDRSDILILKLSLSQVLSGHLEHDVFQVHLGHPTDLVLVKLVLFSFLRSFTLRN